MSIKARINNNGGCWQLNNRNLWHWVPRCEETPLLAHKAISWSHWLCNNKLTHWLCCLLCIYMRWHLKQNLIDSKGINILSVISNKKNPPQTAIPYPQRSDNRTKHICVDFFLSNKLVACLPVLFHQIKFF